MSIGTKIADLRNKSKLSQDELATKLSVSKATVAKWETNKSTPDVNRVVEIAKIFNVSTDYLLGNEVKEIIQEPIASIKDKCNTYFWITLIGLIVGILSIIVSTILGCILLLLSISIPLILIIKLYSNNKNDDNKYHLLIYILKILGILIFIIDMLAMHSATILYVVEIILVIPFLVINNKTKHKYFILINIVFLIVFILKILEFTI